jgi:hypothetical protein
VPRWLRVVRGMVGTGLTFAAGVGVVAALTGAFVWLAGGIAGRELTGRRGDEIAHGRPRPKVEVPRR